jgi:hypothetical protein
MNGNLPEAYKHLCKAFEIAKQEHTTVDQRDASSIADTGADAIFNVPLQPAAANGHILKWPRLSKEEVVTTLSLTKSFDLRTDGVMMSADALARRNDGGSIGRDDWTLASAFVVFNIGIIYAIGGTQGTN